MPRNPEFLASPRQSYRPIKPKTPKIGIKPTLEVLTFLIQLLEKLVKNRGENLRILLFIYIYTIIELTYQPLQADTKHNAERQQIGI